MMQCDLVSTEYMQRLHARIAALEAQRDRLREALRKLVWSLSHRPAQERQPYRDEYIAARAALEETKA